MMLDEKTKEFMNGNQQIHFHTDDFRKAGGFLLEDF